MLLDTYITPRVAVSYFTMLRHVRVHFFESGLGAELP